MPYSSDSFASINNRDSKTFIHARNFAAVFANMRAAISVVRLVVWMVFINRRYCLVIAANAGLGGINQNKSGVLVNKRRPLTRR